MQYSARNMYLGLLHSGYVLVEPVLPSDHVRPAEWEYAITVTTSLWLQTNCLNVQYTMYMHMYIHTNTGAVDSCFLFTGISQLQTMLNVYVGIHYNFSQYNHIMYLHHYWISLSYKQDKTWGSGWVFGEPWDISPLTSARECQTSTNWTWHCRMTPEHKERGVPTLIYHIYDQHAIHFIGYIHT